MAKRKKRRAGKNFYKGDRIRKGRWKRKTWKRSQKSDRKRDGSRYEFWE